MIRRLAMPCCDGSAATLVLVTPEVDLTESGDSFTTLAEVSVSLQSLFDADALFADGHAHTEATFLTP